MSIPLAVDRGDRLPPAVENAVQRLVSGRPIVVVDDEDRENEADLVVGAAFADLSMVGFFLRHTSGYLCVALSAFRSESLGLGMMTDHNTDSHNTAFLQSVDLASTSSGVSASDRAATIRALAAGATGRRDLTSPGHVFPLQARAGGVLRRAGHTEASVELCEMAGLAPAALICEMVGRDRTTMMREPEITEFAALHDLPVVRIAELVDHRFRTEPPIRRTADSSVETAFGAFRSLSYRSSTDETDHLALVRGDVAGRGGVMVRVHSECVTGDVLGSAHCDCGPQLRLALRQIAGRDRGIMIYLRGHEGRGIGIGRKLLAYRMQEGGADTVDANVRLGLPVDAREYDAAAHILGDLGVRSVDALTNNPAKVAALTDLGVHVEKRLPLEAPVTPDNVRYLRTKRDRMGHFLSL